jgi:hypothetical protein
MWLFSGHQRRASRAAGVSQPWCAKPNVRCKNIFNPTKSAPVRTVLPNHGGLTPAALVNVRLCTQSFSRERRPSGWRKPAVVRQAECPLQQQIQSEKVGSRSDCVTAPRRADARRSCERAFAHRRSRFHPNDHVVHTTERRASAPRGCANALASALPAHYGQRSPNRTHGG